MRLFIGIKFDPATIEKITRSLKPFKKISTPIRWVKPENIHLTLKFIGEVNEERRFQIEEILGKINFRADPIEINISGFGKFGRNEDLNIFWAGIKKNPDLTALYHEIENSLARINIERETRKFKPHLTLGRNRKRFNFKSFFPLIEKYANLPVVTFITASFQLFQSTLSAQGPTYSILKEINFVNT
jgi:2'-5' RNA ligase